MTNRQIELALKRGRLQERIASQRASLAIQVRPVLHTLETADQGLALARTGLAYVKRHPGQVGITFAVLAILRPARVWRWGRRAFVAWGIWKKLRDGLESTGLSKKFAPGRGTA
jgi:hypothetical protein